MVLSKLQGNSRISPEVDVSNTKHRVLITQKEMIFLKTVKSMLEKARINGKDPYISLLEYRNTPTDVESPAKLFMSQLRSILPITKN